MVLTEHQSVMPLVINSKRHSTTETFTAPECLVRLTSMEVDKGCTVELTVIIAGFPTPEIRWTLDDEEISRDNQRFIFEEDDTQNRYSLIITHITRAQEGVYRCVADNCHGTCSTMGFITVREVMRRRRRNVSRKPKIAAISEWKSQEEKEEDPEGDSFLMRNKHCWDWWNLESLSDNEEVFEKSCEKAEVIPTQQSAEKHKDSSKKGKTPLPNGILKTTDLIPDKVEYNNKVFHRRKEFIRAKSAEPESRLSRKKSESLPDVHKGQVENKYKKLKSFWEQISAPIRKK